MTEALGQGGRGKFRVPDHRRPCAKKCTRQSPQVQRNHPAFPRATGLTAYGALSPPAARGRGLDPDDAAPSQWVATNVITIVGYGMIAAGGLCCWRSVGISSPGHPGIAAGSFLRTPERVNSASFTIRHSHFVAVEKRI